jgi:MYXO-CTERM domain-containing protein
MTSLRVALLLWILVFLSAGMSNVQAAVVAYWRFEPGALNDDSAGSNALSGIIGPTSSLDVAPGAPGIGSASFNGTQSGFKTTSTLDLTALSDMTIEWYMKSIQGAVAIIIEHGGASGTGPFGAAINDQFSDDADELEFYQRTSGFNAYLKGISDSPATPEVTDGNWHHIAATIDGSETAAERIGLFVDGISVGAYVPVGSPSGTPAFQDLFFYVGSRLGTSNKYVGLIDELRISDELLTPDQFLNANSAVPEPASAALWLGLVGLGTVAALRRQKRNHS